MSQGPPPREQPLVEQWLAGKPMRLLANFAQENQIRAQINHALKTYDSACGQYARLAINLQDEAAESITEETENPQMRGQCIGYTAGLYRAGIAVSHVHHWFLRRIAAGAGRPAERATEDADGEATAP